MSRTQNTPLLLALVIGIVLVAGAIIAAVFLAGQKPLVILVPSSPPAGDSAAGPAGSAPTAAEAAPAPPPAAKPPEVSIVRLASVPALQDPFDPAWQKAPAVQVPLQAQQTTVPMLATVTIPAV